MMNVIRVQRFIEFGFSMSLVFHLLEMSDCPLTLFWILCVPSSERCSLVLLTLNHIPIQVLMSWHYFCHQCALQHFPFHRRSSSVVCEVYTTLHDRD